MKRHRPMLSMRPFILLLLAPTMGGVMPAYPHGPLLQQVNTRPSQPFLPGSDSIEQRLDPVTFRLPLDTSPDDIHIILSPWNKLRALLAILRTTGQGAQVALVPASCVSTPDLFASRPSAQKSSRPAWLVPLVEITWLAILAILLTACWQAQCARS